jgi:hypothetical protein
MPWFAISGGWFFYAPGGEVPDVGDLVAIDPPHRVALWVLLLLCLTGSALTAIPRLRVARAGRLVASPLAALVAVTVLVWGAVVTFTDGGVSVPTPVRATDTSVAPGLWVFVACMAVLCMAAAVGARRD